MLKLKLRHRLVIIFLIVLIIGSFGEAVVKKDPKYFWLGIGRAFIGADENISYVINELAEAEQITWAGHSWLIFNMIGSLYLIGYMLYYFYTGFCQRFIAPDTTIIGAFILFFPLMWMLKILFFVYQGQVTGEPFDLTSIESWTHTIPFSFIYDLVKNFDKLYYNFEPIINQTKNFTKPFTGIGGNLTNGTKIS